MPGDPTAAWPVSIAPGFMVSILVSLLSALVFHALLGRGARGFGIALIASLLGFTCGEALARSSGTSFGMLGTVHLLQGIAGAWLALIGAGIFERKRAATAARDKVTQGGAPRAASGEATPPPRDRSTLRGEPHKKWWRRR